MSQFSILKISELKAINNNKSFYRFILILSGDISLNPGPVYNHHLLNLKEWDIFKTKRFHLLYLNVNSLLPKIDVLSNAAVIGIAEYKLDNYFLDSEIQIEIHQILLCDRNRKSEEGCLLYSFLQTLNENFAKFDTLKNELYILGDFNVNVYQNQNHADWKSNTLVVATVFNDFKNFSKKISTLHNVWLNTINKMSNSYSL